MKDLGMPVAVVVAFVVGGCEPIGSGAIESRDLNSLEPVEPEAVTG